MYCIKCGSQLDDEALFCANCGAQVKSRVTDNSSSNPLKINNVTNSNTTLTQNFSTMLGKVSNDQKARMYLLFLIVCLLIFNFLPCATIKINEKEYYSFMKFLFTEGVSFNFFGERFSINWFGAHSVSVYKFLVILILLAEIAQIIYLGINSSFTSKVKKELRKYAYYDVLIASTASFFSWFVPAVVEHQCTKYFDQVYDYGMGLSNVYMKIHLIFYIPLILAAIIVYVVRRYIPKRHLDDVIYALNSGMYREAIEYYKEGDFAKSDIKSKNKIFLAIIDSINHITKLFSDNNISHKEALQMLDILNGFELAPEEVKDAITVVNNRNQARIKNTLDDPISTLQKYRK